MARRSEKRERLPIKSQDMPSWTAAGRRNPPAVLLLSGGAQIFYARFLRLSAKMTANSENLREARTNLSSLFSTISDFMPRRAKQRKRLI